MVLKIRTNSFLRLIIGALFFFTIKIGYNQSLNIKSLEFYFPYNSCNNYFFVISIDEIKDCLKKKEGYYFSEEKNKDNIKFFENEIFKNEIIDTNIIRGRELLIVWVNFSNDSTAWITLIKDGPSITYSYLDGMYKRKVNKEFVIKAMSYCTDKKYKKYIKRMLR